MVFRQICGVVGFAFGLSFAVFAQNLAYQEGDNLANPILDSDPSPSEEGRDYAIREVLVWKGVVRAYYQEKKSLKIRIYRNHKLPLADKFREGFREEILGKTWTIFRDQTQEPIAEFEPRELNWEKISDHHQNPGEVWEAVVWGEIKPSVSLTPLRLSQIMVNSYIAKYKKEYSYLEPHNFFGKKTSPIPKRILHPKDGKEMLLVGRGAFLYGQGMDSSESSFHPEFFRPNPGNLNEIAPFYMDKYEVTNGEYLRYLNETGTSPPKHWKNGKYPPGEKDHPVDFLSYEEVAGYANWTGKKIPTEWEWEKAARGLGVRFYYNRDETLGYDLNPIIYPWGNEYDASLCNTKESGLGKTLSVYRLPLAGSSPYGILGMCGNAPEWTSSWYGRYPGQPYSLKGYGTAFRVIRGGSYREDADVARVFHRSYGGIPNLKEDRKAGFRLIQPVR